MQTHVMMIRTPRVATGKPGQAQSVAVSRAPSKRDLPVVCFGRREWRQRTTLRRSVSAGRSRVVHERSKSLAFSTEGCLLDPCTALETTAGGGGRVEPAHACNGRAWGERGQRALQDFQESDAHIPHYQNPLHCRRRCIFAWEENACPPAPPPTKSSCVNASGF